GAIYGELPFADYLRMARVMVSLGIIKVRITGGEPLLRKGVVEFVRELRKLRPQAKPELFGGTRTAAESWNGKEGHANAALKRCSTPEPKELDIAITTNGHLLADLARPL